MTWQELRMLLRAVRASNTHRPLGYFCDGWQQYRLRVRDECTGAVCIVQSAADWEVLCHAHDH